VPGRGERARELCDQRPDAGDVPRRIGVGDREDAHQPPAARASSSWRRRDRPPRELALDPRPRRESHARRELAVGEQARQRVGERGHVALGEEQPGLAVGDRQRDAGDVGRHDRLAARHRFGDHHRQAVDVPLGVAHRRHHEQLAQGLRGEHLGMAERPREDDVVGDTQRPRLRREGLGERSAAAEHQLDARLACDERRQRRDQDVEPLLVDQPPDGDDHPVIRRDAEARCAAAVCSAVGGVGRSAPYGTRWTFAA
jgi:hypothetical protein